MGIIYGLVDPRLPQTAENVRYVGQTTAALELRLRKHIETAKRGDATHRGYWIQSLLANGLRPTIIRLAESYDLDPAERWWIAELRRHGTLLANGTSGGSGGHTLSEEQRTARSVAMKARWADPEYRQSMADAHKGKTLSESAREKVSAASKAHWAIPANREHHIAVQLGKPKAKHPALTPEQLDRVREANRRSWENNPERRQRQSAAMRGNRLTPHQRTQLREGLRRARLDHPERFDFSRAPKSALHRARISESNKRTWAAKSKNPDQGILDCGAA